VFEISKNEVSFLPTHLISWLAVSKVMALIDVSFFETLMILTFFINNKICHCYMIRIFSEQRYPGMPILSLKAVNTRTHIHMVIEFHYKYQAISQVYL